ncbi:hypothetical protein PFISCL1PPCAC_5511, partial [Pristionchus fissidentatus]
KKKKKKKMTGGEGPSDEPLLTAKTHGERTVDVESPGVRIVKRRLCECCTFCCKVLCIAVTLTIFGILFLAVAPAVKGWFAPVKTEVNWSKPHSKEVERRMRELVDIVNRGNGTWKARYNPFAHATEPSRIEASDLDYVVENVKETVGNTFQAVKEAFSPDDLMGDTVEHLESIVNMSLSLPSSFDAREKWSKCQSIHQISNQGACGSCWGMAAASVMSDRLCISSNYTRQETVSTQDLLSCCPKCGSCGGGGFLISPFV